MILLLCLCIQVTATPTFWWYEDLYTGSSMSDGMKAVLGAIMGLMFGFGICGRVMAGRLKLPVYVG